MFLFAGNCYDHQHFTPGGSLSWSWVQRCDYIRVDSADGEVSSAYEECSNSMEWARNRKGQTVVIVALCMLALVAFVGLAVDGGSSLLQRRTMQNAADAGALAAIQVMQEGGIAVTCVNSSGTATTCQDRKSTRLNSSHMSIS